MDYDYSWDLVGNVTEKSTEHGDYSYVYDAINRLTQADYPTFSTDQWSYDPLGNRLTDAETGSGFWEYNDNNELLNSIEHLYDYDANGSLIVERLPDGTVHRRHEYNAETRLIAVRDGAGELIAEYQYDPFGRRIRSTIYDPPGQSPQIIWKVYSDNGLLAELDDQGQTAEFYLLPPDGLWGTAPILRLSGSSYYYYQTDHLGTPQMIFDGSGAVVRSQEMRAFGEVLANGIEDNLRFPGQFYSAETGFYHNFFRDYAPRLGRYVQSDPIGLEGGNNIYSYAEFNPLLWIDPIGLNAWNEFQRQNPAPSPINRIRYRQRQLDQMGSPRAGNRGTALEWLGDFYCWSITRNSLKKLNDIYWKLWNLEQSLEDCDELCYIIFFEITQFIQRQCVTNVFYSVTRCPNSGQLVGSPNNFITYEVAEEGTLRGNENICCPDNSSR